MSLLIGSVTSTTGTPITISGSGQLAFVEYKGRTFDAFATSATLRVMNGTTPGAEVTIASGEDIFWVGVHTFADGRHAVVYVDERGTASTDHAMVQIFSETWNPLGDPRTIATSTSGIFGLGITAASDGSAWIYYSTFGDSGLNPTQTVNLTANGSLSQGHATSINGLRNVQDTLTGELGTNYTELLIGNQFGVAQIDVYRLNDRFDINSSGLAARVTEPTVPSNRFTTFISKHALATNQATDDGILAYISTTTFQEPTASWITNRATTLKVVKFGASGNVVFEIDYGEYDYNTLDTEITNVDAALLADGRFIVAWTQGGYGYVRLYSASGEPLTRELTVGEASFADRVVSISLESNGDDVYVSWVEKNVPGQGSTEFRYTQKLDNTITFFDFLLPLPTVSPPAAVDWISSSGPNGALDLQVTSPLIQYDSYFQDWSVPGAFFSGSGSDWTFASSILSIETKLYGAMSLIEGAFFDALGANYGIAQFSQMFQQGNALYNQTTQFFVNQTSWLKNVDIETLSVEEAEARFDQIASRFVGSIGSSQPGVAGAILDLTVGQYQDDPVANNYKITILGPGATVQGSNLTDRFVGGAGANTIIGLGGNDILFGRDGKDTIDGGSGNDLISGGRGADRLIGGTGNDRLAGGADADTFVMSLGAGADTVTDFKVLEGDRLDVSAFANIKTLADIKARSTGSTINFGAGDSITLTSVAISSLTSSSFIFNGQQSSGNAPIDITLSKNSISETSGIGSIVGTLTASDPDVGDSFTYTLLDSASGKFTLSGSTLTLAGPIDYETATSHTVRVRVKDSGNNILERDFIISVLDAGGNTIVGTPGIDKIALTSTVPGQGFATTENDTISGAGGNDTVDAAGGNDVVDGGEGDDTLLGGTGLDTVSYANASQGVTVSLSLVAAQNTIGAGRDRLGGFEAIIGSAHGDVLSGDKLANEISGGLGNDTIEGLGGADRLNGGGQLTDLVSYARSVLGVEIDLNLQDGVAAQRSKKGAASNGDAAGDILSGFAGVIGSAKADKITGSAGNNLLEGGGGADEIVGGGGQDRASYTRSTAAVVVDLLTNINQGGHAQGDKLLSIYDVTGSKFNDTLIGNSGSNWLIGGDGNDTIVGGGGLDTLEGGNGIDTLHYGSEGDGVTVDLANSTSSADALVSGFENVIGSSFNDVLKGSDGANRIEGGDGDDLIEGGLGNDTLIGGGLATAPGLDTATYANAGGSVTVSLAIAKAQNTGGAGTDTLTGFENLVGSAFADTLTGDSRANTIIGGDGNDLIQGGLGADVLDGGAGSGDTVSYAASKLGVTIDLAVAAQNTLFASVANGDAAGDILTGFENLIGTAKADVLIGNSGNNVIQGGLGNDVLAGDLGTDTISFESAVAAVTFSLALQSFTQATGGAGNDLAVGFENVIGGKGADKLTGDAFDNVLKGGLGADTLEGGLGADTFLFAALAEKGDRITDFTSGSDRIVVQASGFAGLTNGQVLINNSTFIQGPALGTPVAVSGQASFLYDIDDGKLYFDADGNAAGAKVLLAVLQGSSALSSSDIVIV